MKYFEAAVDTIRPVGAGLYWMVLNDCADLESALPGQFAMVRPGHWGADPLLGRPLSLLGVSDGQAEFLIQQAGRGTSDMVRMKAGNKVSVLGPMGTSFPEPIEDSAYVLVAGGVGLAPLLMWLERFQAEDDRRPAVRLLYGARTAPQLVFLNRMEALGTEVQTATEDGSMGHRGLVTDLLVQTLKQRPGPGHPEAEGPAAAAEGKAVRVFACGPPTMMAAAAKLCQLASAPLTVSLENRMACGRGICLGCALATPGGETYLVCRDGPVIEADRVDWSGF